MRTLAKKKVEQIKGFTILLNIGNMVRFYFNNWKESANKASLSKEMHEEGPIREEIFEDKIVLSNIRDLMKSEGYHEKDV